MADRKLSDPQIQQDEVDLVLTALRRLYQKVSSPIIRACLEAARTDIAYLADTGDDSEEDGLEDELEAAAA